MDVLAIIGASLSFIGLLITLITIIVKLNTSIVKLGCAVDGLNRYTESNTKCHDEFKETLGDHETRISVIEDWRKGVD